MLEIRGGDGSRKRGETGGNREKLKIYNRGRKEEKKER